MVGGSNRRPWKSYPQAPMVPSGVGYAGSGLAAPPQGACGRPKLCPNSCAMTSARPTEKLTSPPPSPAAPVTLPDNMPIQYPVPPSMTRIAPVWFIRS